MFTEKYGHNNILSSEEGSNKGLNESENQENLTEIDKLISDSKLALKDYESLDFRNDSEYYEKIKSFRKEFKDLSNEIAEKFNLDLNNVFILDKKTLHEYSESVLLGKTVSIAEEAKELNFDSKLDDDKLIEISKKLIEDYKEMSGNFSIKDYGSRLEAKRLLVESIARELASRLGTGDGIHKNSIADLSKKTGVNFSKVVREVIRVARPNEKIDESSGALPAIGASGSWRTPNGYVNGTVVSGRVGGPYTIDTPQGKIKVDNIL